MKSLPAWAWSVKTGRKPTVMTRREKKSDGPTSFAASMMTSTVLFSTGLTRVLLPLFQLLMGILHHDDRGIHHGADGDGDAGEAHDVGGDPDVVHEMKDMMMATGSVRMTTRALGRWKRKTRQTTLTAMASFTISSFRVAMERLMRSDRSYVVTIFTPGGSEGSISVLIFCFDPVDDVEHILPEADDDDAAGDLALAVQFGNAPSYLRAELDVGHILQIDRCARSRWCRRRCLRCP